MRPIVVFPLPMNPTSQIFLGRKRRRHASTADRAFSLASGPFRAEIIAAESAPAAHTASRSSGKMPPIATSGFARAGLDAAAASCSSPRAERPGFVPLSNTGPNAT